MTAEVNYANRIRNERCVVRCPEFNSPEQLRDYLVKYGYGKKEQYTIIPREDEQ